MRLGIWTPLPHTVAPEPRMARAVEELQSPVEGDAPDASFQFAIDVLQKAERHGFDMTLIAARHLGPDLEAWTLASALAMKTTKMELMVAAHPGIVNPQMVAKMGASLDRISAGRFSINIVNGWNVEEFATFGNGAWLTSNEDRYRRMHEFIEVINGLWTSDPFSFHGRFYTVENSRLPLKPRNGAPPIYAASRSSEGKEAIARFCDHWFVPDRGDFRLFAETRDLVETEIGWMNLLAAEHGRAMGYGISAHVVCRATMEEAAKRAEELEAHGRAARYNKSSIAGLGAGLVGTPEVIAERLSIYEKLGLGLVLLQFSPMEEGFDRFVSDVLPLLGRKAA